MSNIIKSVTKKYILLAVIILLCFAQCMPRVKTKGIHNKISILYISNWNLTQIAKIATLITSEKRLNPTLVLLNGEIFTKSEMTDVHKGVFEIDLLNASQIDAVLLSPDFLTWGIDYCKELVKKSNFYCLSANIKDKKTNQSLGQEYLIKSLGKIQISIIGINYDRLNFLSKDINLEFRSPEFVALKLIPLVEHRSDFQFILTQSNDSLDLPVDIIFGAPKKKYIEVRLPEHSNYLEKSDFNIWTEPGIYKLQIGFDDANNIIELTKKDILIDSLPADSIVTTIISEYKEKTDSILNMQNKR